MKKSLIALAFGTLALGMAEFVMMGILPDVARDLGVSIPRAGDLISAYAVGVCVGAPATVLIARKRALKGILLALAALIVLGNVCASLAPDFWVLLAMRFVSGLPHGAFFGVGSIVAERVADPGHKTQAVSIMILGMTVANLFCVPLGTYLGSYLSWRLAFGMVGLWGIMALLLIARWVPALPALPDTGLKGQFRFLGSRAPWLILLATLLANGGVFCWYSYVTPTMTRVAGISGQAMTAVMMVAGLGMLVGNLAGSDRLARDSADVPDDGFALRGFIAPATAYSGECAGRGDARRRVDPDRVQPRQRFGRLLRRSADQFRPGASICRPARCGDGPAGLRHVLRLLQSLRSE